MKTNLILFFLFLSLKIFSCDILMARMEEDITEVNVEFLPAGIYLISLFAEENSLNRQIKFVKT